MAMYLISIMKEDPIIGYSVPLYKLMFKSSSMSRVSFGLAFVHPPSEREDMCYHYRQISKVNLS